MSCYDTLDEGRRKKLPRFAQDYIQHLENRIRELEGIQTKQEKTAVAFGFTMKCDEEGYLPNHTSVRFDLGVDGVVECYRRPIGKRFVLDVHTLRRGLLIEPCASNSIRIIEEP